MTRFPQTALAIATSLCACLFGCSDDSPVTVTSSSGSSGNASGGSAGTGGNGSGATSGTGAMAGSGAAGGFSPTTTGSSSGGSGGDCGATLNVTIRDFKQEHPDFETFSGTAETTGLVENDLGMDGKPVFLSVGNPQQLTGAATFAQWYNDVADVNLAVPIQLTLVETTPGTYSYQNAEFFPVDGQGWGDEGNPHNFHFTTEIHTNFTYEGGEIFTFTGDDDLWLFINDKLALDLGGLHPEVTGTVDLDASANALGITAGNDYAMDIFHAERHQTQSNFRIDTTISCFVPPPQ